MQFHTCMASGSLSFRCDSVRLEAVGNRSSSCRSLSCLVHSRPIPVLVCLGCYMPTSSRLVRPRTTPYWERSALIPFVTSHTTLSFVDALQTNTSLFSVLCPHSHLPGNFSVGHPFKDYSKSRILNCGVLMEWATKKKIHIVDIGSTCNAIFLLKR